MSARCLQLIAFVTFVVMLVLFPPKVYGDQLSLDAAKILQTHCYSCHGAKHNGDPQLDVTNLSFMKTSAKGFIVPGAPDKSKIYKRIAAGEMPPSDSGKAAVSPTDLSILRDWITKGAKADGAKYEQRQLVTERWVRDVIRKDITRKTFRYFSFANLYNQGLSEEELATARAALSKTINLLHLTRFRIIPKQVDDRGLVYRVDTIDLDWNNKQVQKLFDEYPYHEAAFYFRADWFIAKALVPPLYYDLLALPKTSAELEQGLQINSQKAFLDGRSIRIGTTNSRVANFNRVLERIAATDGPYWLSYDFKNQDDAKDIVQNPLGPAFAENPFSSTAFAHDGSEIIFTLPNGFPGFFVVNAKGDRLDKAPEDVVTDTTKISHTAAVVPGLSCITCHTDVVQTKIADSVRSGFAFGGAELEHVATIYRNQRELNLVLDADREKYVRALDSVIKPFVVSRLEPIRPVVERYNQQLTLEQAAVEVSVDPRMLLRAIIGTPDLQKKGLRPLTEGKTISRQIWESPKFDFTPAQTVVKVLALFQE